MPFVCTNTTPRVVTSELTVDIRTSWECEGRLPKDRRNPGTEPATAKHVRHHHGRLGTAIGCGCAHLREHGTVVHHEATFAPVVSAGMQPKAHQVA